MLCPERETPRHLVNLAWFDDCEVAARFSSSEKYLRIHPVDNPSSPVSYAIIDAECETIASNRSLCSWKLIEVLQRIDPSSSNPVDGVMEK